MIVVGLPRSGTTYLFGLLQRMLGDRCVALRCYDTLFHERCVAHVGASDASPESDVTVPTTTEVERWLDEYFQNIGLLDRLIDKVPASAQAAEEYLHWLLPRHARRRLDRNPELAAPQAFGELGRRMLLVARSKQHTAPSLSSSSLSSSSAPRGRWTLLHKNPEEVDAVRCAAAAYLSSLSIDRSIDRATALFPLRAYTSRVPHKCARAHARNLG
eukprot:COSAG01_NODE_3668_length_5811_cov_52.307598_8_plen_215_part_00